jgi:thiamine pyrophosphokinase
MNKFAILLGGSLTPTARLRAQLEGARVIAADSGITHASALGLEPELWVGDFDSAGSELPLMYQHVERQTHPTNKDASDGDLAISEAFRRGATEIMLLGGFGGQYDHVLAHTAMLLAMAKREVPCMMTSGDEEAYPLSFESTIPDVPAGTRVSIVPMSDIKGLTIRGVQWPLEHKSVPFGSTLTLSNIATGGLSVHCDIGTGLVVLYP